MEQNAQQPTVSQKPAATALTGVRKRQQIEMTNKRIFIWVAVASVVVSFSLVAMQFLVKELLFNQKIINAKNATNNTLVANLETAKQLKENVNKLLADENLGSVEGVDQNAETSNLSLILDALPVEGDATSFANSLQAAVLPRSGVAIDKLDTSSLLTTDAEGGAGVTSTSSAEPQAMPFTVTFGGSFQQVSQAMGDMAKVIRPISVGRLELTANDSSLTVAVNGTTYFVPAKSVSITQKALSP